MTSDETRNIILLAGLDARGDTMEKGSAAGSPGRATWRRRRVAALCTIAPLVTLAACTGAGESATKGTSSPTPTCPSPSSAPSSTPSPTTTHLCGNFAVGKAWTGPIHIDASATGAYDNESGAGDGTVTLDEDANGNLSGSVQVHASSGCKLPGQKHFDLKVIGQIAQGQLTISAVHGEVVEDSMGDAICGFPDGFLGDKGEKGSPITPMVIPVVSDTHAKGSGTIIDQESPNTPYHVTIRFTYSMDLTFG